VGIFSIQPSQVTKKLVNITVARLPGKDLMWAARVRGGGSVAGGLVWRLGAEQIRVHGQASGLQRDAIGGPSPAVARHGAGFGAGVSAAGGRGPHPRRLS
jgi:hypothetical protein